MNSIKNFVGFMTVEHEGLSVNKSIHPIMDIFGQLLFRLAVPRRSFTEVQYFVRRLPQSRGVKEYIRCLSIHFKLRVIVSDNAGCPSIGRLLYHFIKSIFPLIE